MSQSKEHETDWEFNGNIKLQENNTITKTSDTCLSEFVWHRVGPYSSSCFLIPFTCNAGFFSTGTTYKSKPQLRNSLRFPLARPVSPTPHLPGCHLQFISMGCDALTSSHPTNRHFFRCVWHLGREKHMKVIQPEDQTQIQTNKPIIQNKHEKPEKRGAR